MENIMRTESRGKAGIMLSIAEQIFPYKSTTTISEENIKVIGINARSLTSSILNKYSSRKLFYNQQPNASCTISYSPITLFIQKHTHLVSVIWGNSEDQITGQYRLRIKSLET